jgi:hypothetical protein
MVDTTGEQDIRAVAYDRIVKGFALQEFKIKPLVMVQPSSAWTESYYQEAVTGAAGEIVGGTGSAVAGVPRLANFPYGEPNWTLQQARLIKYGMEGVISWEDSKTNAVDVVARTLLRVARAVAYAVDTAIYAALLAGVGNTKASEAEWDNAVVASRNPIQDILNACQMIASDNVDVLDGSGAILLNPVEWAMLLGNSGVRNAGQFWTDSVTANGKVGRICGLDIIVSNVVTSDSGTLVIKKKECAVWKEAAPLTTVTIVDPGVKTTVRAWEVGVLQVVNPNCIGSITNTKV